MMSKMKCCAGGEISVMQPSVAVVGGFGGRGGVVRLVVE